MSIKGPYDWTDYAKLTIFDLVETGQLVTVNKLSNILNISGRVGKIRTHILFFEKWTKILFFAKISKNRQ